MRHVHRLSAHDYFEQQYVLRKSLPTFAQDVAPFLKAGMDCIIAEYRLMPTFRLQDLVDDTASVLRRIAAIARPIRLSFALAGKRRLGRSTILLYYGGQLEKAA